MSAQSGSSALGRGSTDAGRPAGPAPHPVQPADGTAWADGAEDGAAAWDDAPRGGASAWDDDAEGSAAAWDPAVPAVGTGWEAAVDDEPAPAPAPASAAASVWDDAAPAPASSWDDGPGADGALPADEPTPARRRRTSRATAATAATAGSSAAAPDAGGADEVAAVAARLAEIVGRSGPVRRPVSEDDPTSDDPIEPDPPRAATPGRRYGGGSSTRSGGARRTGGGRRRAPASEPPEDGPAAYDAEPDHESVARSVALRLLTGAPKSRHQLAEAMARRDVPEGVADKVLDRFTEVGLVDDVAYAEILVRSRHAERGLSRRALAQELRRRGVDDEIAQEALEQVDDHDEEQAARALARKKLRATRGLDRETRLRRAYGALGRRGYGGSLVSRVVREELDAEGTDDAAEGTWSGGFGGG